MGKVVTHHAQKQPQTRITEKVKDGQVVVSKDEWDTKEGPSKFMKNVFYIVWCAKRHI